MVGLLRPAAFRADAGSTDGVFSGIAANSNAFTAARVVGEALVCDVWVRTAETVVALRVAYSKNGGRWDFADATVARLSNGVSARTLDAVGSGLYDVHAKTREMAVGAVSCNAAWARRS
ncbi:hypothetical protein M885DRAFT_24778 [Pelagophyceae sp. CCMP2097]|nr:hypothetical protein M885DRAFT_24778 [Pelagophyceae sp. CCMP2097]